MYSVLNSAYYSPSTIILSFSIGVVLSLHIHLKENNCQSVGWRPYWRQIRPLMGWQRKRWPGERIYNQEWIQFEPNSILHVFDNYETFFLGKMVLKWRHSGLLIRHVTAEDRHSWWWRHQMETFSALLAICAGNSPVSGEFPAQRPVTRSFDIIFDVHLNKQLSKQS